MTYEEEIEALRRKNNALNAYLPQSVKEIMINEGIQKLAEGIDLTYQEARKIMTEMMTGRSTDAQIGAFLLALRMKGETIQETSAFASTMREFCFKIHPKVNGRLLDTCGTGGDRIKTFNISTASAFVIAGLGISIAKHGNRSVTSKSGSADVLEKLGFNLDMEPNAVEKIIEDVGIGFMFAPRFHPAMKYVARPRREIGIRTVFNILGPLTNPAGADVQLLGVYDSKLTEPVTLSLKALGCTEAMVVHGLDGLDEISTIGRTVISWLKEDKVSTINRAPRDFGVRRARPEDVRSSTPDESAEIIFKILSGYYDGDDPKKEIVLVNGAAGIIVAGKAEDFSEGLDLARESIDSGAAYEKLKALVKASGDPSKIEDLESKYG